MIKKKEQLKECELKLDKKKFNKILRDNLKEKKKDIKKQQSK